MKIRNGFVSNSSSSSFIAIGYSINIEDITNEMIKKNQVLAFGKYLNDGRDIIQVDNSNIKFFKLFHSFNDDGYSENFSFIRAIKTGSDSFSFKKSDLPDSEKEIEIFSEDSDYHNSNDIETLFQRYTDIDSDDYNKLLNKLYREKKLERINK